MHIRHCVPHRAWWRSILLNSKLITFNCLNFLDGHHIPPHLLLISSAHIIHCIVLYFIRNLRF